MRFIIRGIQIIITIIFLAGCQKEISADFGSTGGSGGGSGTTTPTDSIYLEKYTLAYDEVFSLDSIIYLYQYDTLKRVISGTYTGYEGNTLSIIYDFTYLYNGSDSLPYKYSFLGRNLIVTNPDTTIGFLSYDASGRMIYDSSINSYRSGTDYYKQKNIEKKQYTTANVYFDRIRTALVQPPGSSIDSHLKDTGWLDARKNVISCSSYDYYNSPAFPAIIVYTGIFTYDNKPSPFSYVNVYKNQIEIPGEKSTTVPQHNNFLSAYTENYFTGQPPTPPTIYSTTFTHTFNTLGMPIKTVSSDNEREYFSYRAF